MQLQFHKMENSEKSDEVCTIYPVTNTTMIEPVYNVHVLTFTIAYVL